MQISNRHAMVSGS